MASILVVTATDYKLCDLVARSQSILSELSELSPIALPQIRGTCGRCRLDERRIPFASIRVIRGSNSILLPQVNPPRLWISVHHRGRSEPPRVGCYMSSEPR